MLKTVKTPPTFLIPTKHNGHAEVVKLLCDAGANKDQVTNDGFTHLSIASQQGHCSGREAAMRSCYATKQMTYPSDECYTTL